MILEARDLRWRWGRLPSESCIGESVPCLVLLASEALVAIFGTSWLFLHHLALCLHLPIFTSSCVCLSSQGCLLINTSVTLDQEPTLLQHRQCESVSHSVMSDSATPWTSVFARGTLQTRILEWVAIPFFRWFSQTRDRTWVSYIEHIWATREAKWK